MLVRIAAFAINTQWQVLWWGDHLSTWEPVEIYTQTLGLRCFWDLLTHLPCAMRLAVSPANSIQLTQRGAQKHTLIQPGGRVRVRTNPCMQTLHTVTLLSPGLECQNEYREAVHVCVCVCVLICMCVYACVFAACWQMICLKLTPPTLSQWQQVSSQGPDLCELRWYTVG